MVIFTVNGNNKKEITMANKPVVIRKLGDVRYDY